ncbi:hypothetical protein FXO38_34988 [Capsicum annuum]|nr:hypothetical protein FXO38_34988 [Capsicum annuum]
MDEHVKNTSPHQATSKLVHEFNKNPEVTLISKLHTFICNLFSIYNSNLSLQKIILKQVIEEMEGYQSNSMIDGHNEIDGYNEDNDDVLNIKSVDESISEAQISESQFTFLDEVLRSIDLDFIKKFNVEVEDEFKNKEYDAETNVIKPAEDESEVDVVDKSKLDQQHKTPVHIYEGVNYESKADQDLPDSQLTLLDDLLLSLNVCVNLELSIIVHPSVNKEQQILMHVSRIRQSSRYKELPFTMNFGSTDG